MEFVFKLVEKKTTNPETLNRLRKMMLCFETFVNTVFPEFRVYLSEDETKTTTQDEIITEGIEAGNLKKYGKDNLEAVLWYVKPELQSDFMRCLNHGLINFEKNMLNTQ